MDNNLNNVLLLLSSTDRLKQVEDYIRWQSKKKVKGSLHVA
jgi:hypothetical protein